MRYTAVPKEITSSEVLGNQVSFSPAQYKRVIIRNPNLITVRDFLSRELKRSDLGIEVGSINYIKQSPKLFFRTKGLQAHSFLPDVTAESLTPVNPKAFVKQNLKEGDLIISKDSNIGEIIILDQDYPDWMLSGALYKLPVKRWKYYLLAFIKHPCFREQLDILVPLSATIRHAKTRFLECQVPLPNQNQDEVIEYIEVLTKAAINKEREIKRKHHLIQEKIETELADNQRPIQFKYEFPSLDDVSAVNRLDTNLFRPYFRQREFLIKNYSNGFQSIRELEFGISRGQNLQITNIGKSIYSNKHFPNFYTLMLPKFLSRYGTVDEIEYLGNKNKLKTLNKGDLIFGAEGFEKGRSIIITDESSKTITNIHGITLHHRHGNMLLSIFVKCFLDYLRNTGLVDLYAVGGNGGSLAMKYWDIIPFPNFSQDKQTEIAKLYHNADAAIAVDQLTVDDFIATDNLFNEVAGIVELDKTAKKIKARIDEVIDLIVRDEPVQTDFDFLLPADNQQMPPADIAH